MFELVFGLHEIGIFTAVPFVFVDEYEADSLYDSIAEGGLIRRVSAKQNHLLERTANIQIERVALSLQLVESFRKGDRTRSSIVPAFDSIENVRYIHLLLVLTEL